MAKAILSEPMFHEKILCMCYTNHALDSFLESLVDAGVSLAAITRLGRSPKISERLKSRCMDQLSESTFNRSQNMRFAILKKSAEELVNDINAIKAELLNPRPFSSASWRYFESFAKSQFQLGIIYQH